MGHHYNPQSHLARFAIPGRENLIWTFDRKSDGFKELPIKKVAQVQNFYPDFVEPELNKRFEIPGNRCVAKIIGGKGLTTEEREHMAAFMFNMLSRGPRYREKAYMTARQTLPKVCEDTRGIIQHHPGIDQEAFMKQVDRIEEAWTDMFPQQLLDQIKTPCDSARCIEQIFCMCWEIIPVSEGMQFVTSDCPAHFFEWMGLSDPEVEFTFTLSSDYALVAHRQRGLSGIRYRQRTGSQITKEINRRILRYSSRFVFSRDREDWIGKSLAKRDIFLSQIRWV